jgi:hypothetical protein
LRDASLSKVLPTGTSSTTGARSVDVTRTPGA